MTEFERQIEQNRLKFIDEFNTLDKYRNIRKLYIDNFDKIKKLIIKFNHSQAIEDIANLDEKTKQNVLQNKMLLQQINKAIIDKKFNKNQIEL